MSHRAQCDQLEQHQLHSCFGYKEWDKVVDAANEDVGELRTNVAKSDDNADAETGMEDEEAYCGLGRSLPCEDKGGDDRGHDDGMDQGEGYELQR